MNASLCNFPGQCWAKLTIRM